MSTINTQSNFIAYPAHRAENRIISNKTAKEKTKEAIESSTSKDTANIRLDRIAELHKMVSEGDYKVNFEKIGELIHEFNKKNP